MSTKQRDPLTPLVGPGAEAFKLWISFWPVAPLFGVEWRFADTMGLPKTATSEGKGKSKSGARAGSTSEAAPASKSKKTDTAGETASVVALKPGVVSEKVAPSQGEKQAPAPRKAPEAKIAEKPAATPKPAPAPEAAEKKPEAAASAGAPAPTAQGSEAASEQDAGKKPTNLMSESPATPDDLKMIRGVGPGLESKLNALGIYTFDQIAKFSEDNLVWVDENLTAFKGRCFRDDWIGQAKSLRG